MIRFHKVSETDTSRIFEMCSVNADDCQGSRDVDKHRIYSWGSDTEYAIDVSEIDGLKQERRTVVGEPFSMSIKQMADEVIAYEQSRGTVSSAKDLTARTLTELGE